MFINNINSILPMGPGGERLINALATFGQSLWISQTDQDQVEQE